MRCERCGADAVESSGICRACGWQAADTDDASLGSTRAATGIAPAGGSHQTSTSYADADRRGGTHVNAQFCGACGARLEGQEAFCGQCGAPVAYAHQAGPPVSPNVQSHRPSGPGLSHADLPIGWQTEDSQAYTEAMPEFAGPQPGYGQSRGGLVNGVPAVPGGTPYPYATQVPQPAAKVGVRTGRIVLGVVCLVGSVATAAAAILLAIAPGS